MMKLVIFYLLLVVVVVPSSTSFVEGTTHSLSFPLDSYEKSPFVSPALLEVGLVVSMTSPSTLSPGFGLIAAFYDSELFNSSICGIVTTAYDPISNTILCVSSTQIYRYSIDISFLDNDQPLFSFSYLNTIDNPIPCYFPAIQFVFITSGGFGVLTCGNRLPNPQQVVQFDARDPNNINFTLNVTLPGGINRVSQVFEVSPTSVGLISISFMAIINEGDVEPVISSHPYNPSIGFSSLYVLLGTNESNPIFITTAASINGNNQQLIDPTIQFSTMTVQGAQIPMICALLFNSSLLVLPVTGVDCIMDASVTSSLQLVLLSPPRKFPLLSCAPPCTPVALTNSRWFILNDGPTFQIWDSLRGFRTFNMDPTFDSFYPLLPSLGTSVNFLSYPLGSLFTIQDSFLGIISEVTSTSIFVTVGGEVSSPAWSFIPGLTVWAHPTGDISQEQLDYGDLEIGVALNQTTVLLKAF